MKPMNRSTARTLTVFSTGLTLAGLMIMAPSGALFVLAIALVAAFFPAIFGKGVIRMVAAAILLIALISAVLKIPEFRQEQNAYRRQVEKRQSIEP